MHLALLAAMSYMLCSTIWAGAPDTRGMVLIPSGSYTPFFKTAQTTKTQAPEGERVSVPAFWIDRDPVTASEFARFVSEHPQWQKSKVKRLFADTHYLKDWIDDLSYSQSESAPVTFVSWFAASAYCRSKGKELPTTDQWEYVTLQGERDPQVASARVLAWYGKPNSARLADVGQTENHFGVRDLLGLVWEWTGDFNSAMLTDESRGGGGESTLFCANGTQGSTDPNDYIRFMRFSFRSSLKAHFSIANLGFRCARSK